MYMCVLLKVLKIRLHAKFKKQKQYVTPSKANVSEAFLHVCKKTHGEHVYGGREEM